MNLVNREQVGGFHSHGAGHAGAVFGHIRRHVIGTDAGIEARIEAAGDPAGAREKAMADRA